MDFNCAHAYTHTSNRYAVRLPFALKGVDIVVYTIFRALGLHVNIYPVLERIEDDGDEGELVGTNLHGVVITEEGGSDGYNNKKEARRHYSFAVLLGKS